jgi:hypothetical protein
MRVEVRVMELVGAVMGYLLLVALLGPRLCE